MKSQLGINTRVKLLRWALLAFSVALLTGTSFAGITIYSGFDNGAGSPPHPNSDAAAALFDAATGSLPIITFESAPLGPYSSLVVAPGVTLTGTNSNKGNQSIIDTPGCSPALCGYNTTLGGKQWADVNGGFITFTFSTPISSFGAYFTGVQIAGDSISFFDGSTQTIPLPVDSYSGGTAFVGFVDTNANITSVTINASYDIIGVDDVRYGAPAAAPEPSSITLLGSGVLGLSGMLRKRLLG